MLTNEQIWELFASNYKTKLNENRYSEKDIVNSYKIFIATNYYGNYDEEGMNWERYYSFEKEYGVKSMEMQNLAENFHSFIHKK